MINIIIIIMIMINNYCGLPSRKFHHGMDLIEANNNIGAKGKLIKCDLETVWDVGLYQV